MQIIARKSPATVPGGQAGSFEVLEFREHEKNTLRGFLSLRLPSGIVLHSCTYHVKGSASWVGLPSREYVRDDGEKGYMPVVEIPEQGAREAFQRQAVAAVGRFMEVQK